MNERIEELAQQVDACYIPRYDMWQMDTESLKKFAELIVRECASMADFADKDPGDYVLKHFGVEE